jgi:hypothetical protein
MLYHELDIAEQRSRLMPAVLCAIDGSPSAREGLRAAVAFCAERELDLELVGVVPTVALVPQPALGESVRRFQRVELELVHGLRLAASAGLDAIVAVRAGDPLEELCAEAEAVGAAELFLPRPRSGVLRGLARKPGTGFERVALAPLPEREAALRPAAS